MNLRFDLKTYWKCLFLGFYLMLVALTGNWMQKTLRFFLIYYFGFLVILSLFGLPFGFSLQAIVHFLVIIIVPTIFITGLTAKLQQGWIPLDRFL